MRSHDRSSRVRRHVDNPRGPRLFTLRCAGSSPARRAGGGQAHSPCGRPARALPSGLTPSMSISPEPIIQSMWMKLLLPPRAAISSGGERGAVDEALRIALAERDMAGGVLVEQGVEEQEPALGDRRGVRHQRDLARRRAPSSVSSTLLSTASPRLAFASDDAALLEAHRDLVDQGALVGQRLGAADVAFHPPGVWRGEDLLGRDVGVAGDAVLRRRGAALHS